MSERTVDARVLMPSVGTEPRGSPHEAPKLGHARGYAWALGTIVLLAVSTAVVLWAGTSPGYDPYGWLVWGHQTLAWNLDTNGAPSWKPLPYLFTLPYALVGDGALWLWVRTAVAVSLAGVVFAARIAYRLTGGVEQRRASLLAGAFAGCALLGITGYAHYILSDQSDPMIVSLCLGAIDCLLSKRPRITLVLLVLAALGRPEAWPFLGPYAIWLWRRDPQARPLIAGGLALIPLLWFGIPALTARSFFIAGELALNSPRALHSDVIIGTIDRFRDLHVWPVEAAALLAVAWAAYRRDRVVLALAGAALAWVVIEIAFVLHGWPGVPRYLFEPIAVVAVLAGIAVGRVLVELPRFAPAIGSWGAIVIVAMFIGALVPDAVHAAQTEHKDLKRERQRTQEIERLGGAIRTLGASKQIQACGQPTTQIEYQSVLAWTLGLNVGDTYYDPDSPHAIVNFIPVRNGWIVTTHQPTTANGPPPHITDTAAQTAACRRIGLVPQRFLRS
ncbi:MAG: hypothetical protein ACLP0J_15745 [Solirubrobacteraceae bacterium]